MTTAPQTYGSGTVMPAETVHVTGRRVVATLIDGLIFGIAYWLLALAFGDLRIEGEAANWVSNLPVWASVAYGLFVIGYYVLLEGYLGQTVGKLATGIKVVSEATGATPGIAAAAIRTLLRLIDACSATPWRSSPCWCRASGSGWATWRPAPLWSASSRKEGWQHRNRLIGLHRRSAAHRPGPARPPAAPGAQTPDEEGANDGPAHPDTTTP
ncbi:MAG TPA: RDD family protein [Actinomycetes bacterium]|nr:RDD family protein [Actinomycetes bacterium]